jgi:hypothetical protein
MKTLLPITVYRRMTCHSSTEERAIAVPYAWEQYIGSSRSIQLTICNFTDSLLTAGVLSPGTPTNPILPNGGLPNDIRFTNGISVAKQHELVNGDRAFSIQFPLIQLDNHNPLSGKDRRRPDLT